MDYFERVAENQHGEYTHSRDVCELLMELDAMKRLEGARIWNAWTAIIALLITEQAMDDCEPYRWREYLALQEKPRASEAIKRAWGSSKQDE